MTHTLRRSPACRRSFAWLPLAAALVLGAVAGPTGARDRSYLPPEVERALARRKVPASALSVYVREVGRDEPIVSYNPDVARNPASTMKVVTTYAALEALGPTYTWRTRAYATGQVRNQVLEGDLVLQGGGDPFMTSERFWAFVQGLRQAGIQRITGDVVIDNSYFAPQGDDRGAFDNRPYRTYNVLPDALLVNFQTVTLTAVPDAAAGVVRVSANPWPSNLVIDNNVRLTPGPCKRGAAGIVVTMPEGALGNRLSLSGRYAAGCGQYTVSRAVMKAPDYAYGAFRALWQQAGGTLDGSMRLGTVPAGARLVHTHESLALAEVVRLVNKYSSNSMARALLLTLGAERYPGRPATTVAGREAVQEFLSRQGIAMPDLVLENGSGLSRTERVTAAGLADLLQAAYRSQYMPEFAASLPLSALDGTLRRRFRSSEMQGRLRMKTGTLEDVTALAGYVNAASGRTYVTVVILNHPTASQGPGEDVQTELIKWVFRQ